MDKMMLAGHLFRNDQTNGELVLDNNDLERERGITILSKNVSINYKGTKINIIDTPGHADFGGEVERVLNMADGCILLVDAFEGPMPQTRFVLQKALQIGLKPVVVVNKVDKPNCRPEEVYEMVFDLMFSLNATEDQLDFPVIYGSAKNNWMSTDWKTPTENLVPLLDAIIEHIPAPKQLEGTPQMLITSLDYSAYTGRIAVGRVHRGTLKEGMNITLAKRDGSLIKSKIKELHTFEGLGRKKTNAVSSGDICAVVGVEGFEIGDTICDFENPEPLPPIAIDEPTMSMLFTINDSPFFGKEGKFVTSRHIQDRLTKELDKNLALRVRKSELEDGKWIVSGRGVLHLSVLIETMRREGYELQVGQPQVIFKEIDGVKCEPIEELTISVPEEYSSKMIDMVTRRKGDLVSMETQGDRVNIEFDMPSRGIIGLRTNVLTASAGEAIMAHRFKCYQPYKGEIERRSNGSMIAMESGTAFAYAIDKLQDRGKFFIYPQDEVYAGQVVGEHVHENDLVINVTKSKKLTNMRASGSDDKARIIPPVVFSLEEALEYIKEDEYVEVTPKSMRMRKVILDETERKRANKS
ncbi:GTP-binding protein TypA/BipA [Phocaeicola vulgatus str. 3775 SR(B) 19]|nr:GTP-binding protein TypA/BipA [Phocaeicola vulgatus str. 3775 SR(B) 19]